MKEGMRDEITIGRDGMVDAHRHLPVCPLTRLFMVFELPLILTYSKATQVQILAGRAARSPIRGAASSFTTSSHSLSFFLVFPTRMYYGR